MHSFTWVCLAQMPPPLVDKPRYASFRLVRQTPMQPGKHGRENQDVSNTHRLDVAIPGLLRLAPVMCSDRRGQGRRQGLRHSDVGDARRPLCISRWCQRSPGDPALGSDDPCLALPGCHVFVEPRKFSPVHQPSPSWMAWTMTFPSARSQLRPLPGAARPPVDILVDGFHITWLGRGIGPC